MAPTNGPSKGRKGPVRKPIVPVIPLPMDRKRASLQAQAQQQQPPSQTKTNGAAPDVPPVVQLPEQPVDSKVNGVVPVEEKKAVQEVVNTVQAVADQLAHGANNELPANGDSHTDASSITSFVIKPDRIEPADIKLVSAPPQLVEPTPSLEMGALHINNNHDAHPSHPTTMAPHAAMLPSVENNQMTTQAAMAPHAPLQPETHVEAMPHMGPSHVPPPVHFQGPLGFQPVPAMARMPTRPPVNGPPHMHHPHPSNGSVQFGGLPDSNNSSPAPLSSGHLPPPYSHQAGHRPATMEQGSAPAYFQFGENGPVPTTSAETVRISPPGPHFGPSTPHSFHGSQSSAHPDDGYAARAALNGSYGHPEQHQPLYATAFVARQRMTSFYAPPPEDDVNALVDFTRQLQGMFANPTFSDCTLILRPVDGRFPPVQLPGHCIVLARSPTIRAILEATTPDSSPHGLSPRNIVLQSDDKFLRPDAFWFAVQRLYERPMLELPPDMHIGNESSRFTPAGSLEDQFDFALSYAAAGSLLRWQPMVVRGVEVAMRLLSWSNIERALEFALRDVARGTLDPSLPQQYRPNVWPIVDNVLEFIMQKFPADFTLDTSVIDGDKYPRIPTVPILAAPPKRPMPTIVRGTSGHLGSMRNGRLSHIKFGDLSPAGAHSDGHRGPNQDREPAQTLAPPWHATISRVLLNVPHYDLRELLKELQEYPRGPLPPSALTDPESRRRLIRTMIAEREARRLRAVEAVKAGRVSNAGEILARLNSVEPRRGNEWDVLGWQEEVVISGKPEVTAIVERWVPIGAPDQGLPTPSSPEYP